VGSRASFDSGNRNLDCQDEKEVKVLTKGLCVGTPLAHWLPLVGSRASFDSGNRNLDCQDEKEVKVLTKGLCVDMSLYSIISVLVGHFLAAPHCH
jgi:hypothetical protein